MRRKRLTEGAQRADKNCISGIGSDGGEGGIVSHCQVGLLPFAQRCIATQNKGLIFYFRNRMNHRRFGTVKSDAKR